MNRIKRVIELQKAQACAAAPNCTVVINGSGSGVNVNAK